MKKIVLSLLMSCVAVSMLAQQTPTDKARVAEIRKAYTEAKNAVAKSEQLLKAGKPANMTVVNSSYTLGSGAGKVITNYYYTQEEDTLLGRYFYEPFLITNNYSAPGYQYYQEFLYDKDSNLMFYYEKNDGNETRFYFDKDGENGDEGLVHEINSRSRTMEPPFAIRVGYELKNAFHLLMNREF